MNRWKRLLCACRRRGPWLFHMNSGSCNGCDIELIACLTPRYDAEQLGVRLQGSPRHADILCITGPVTKNSVDAIHTVYEQVCGPKAVVAIGSCPATTNVLPAHCMSTFRSMCSWLDVRRDPTPFCRASPRRLKSLGRRALAKPPTSRRPDLLRKRNRAR